jgi:hypothetical protein
MQGERTRQDNRAEYRLYLQSPHWQATRKAALERAGQRCQLCNRAGRLDVHHRTYERVGHEKPGDLTVLCRKCHDIFHGAARVKAAGFGGRTFLKPDEQIARSDAILRILEADGPLTLAMLADRMECAYQVVGVCLVSLRKRGYVAKSTAQKKRWQLTAKGSERVTGRADRGLGDFLTGEIRRAA